MKENNFDNKNFGGKVEKIRIPDDDMTDWIKTLMEAGFSEEERENMLMRLNKTYRDIKISKEEQINRELKEFEEHMLKKHKYFLNDEQRARFRKLVELKLDLEASDT